MVGPKTLLAKTLHAEKYRTDGETFRGYANRVAGALADDGQFHHLRNGLLHQRLLPGGRVQSAIGSVRNVTPYNCFVAPTIQDSFVDGDDSIMDVAKAAAATMRMGGGIGYDFSTLRPKHSMIKRLDSQSSGPISFMQIFDSICKCIASSGHRRGAQMAVMRVDHPDIMEFINAKANRDQLTAFNLSVGITDEFMQAVEDGTTFNLRFDGQVYSTYDARLLWDAIMRNTWDWAEPGILFIDRINNMNNLKYCETIAATNPCAEQPLPPNGACLLGSLNLVKYVTERETNRFEVARFFDWDLFATDIHAFVRAMDNIVDLAVYPLEAQKQEAQSKRRMGIGVTGLANAVEALSFDWRYGSEGFLMMTDRILKRLTRECYLASVQLAKEKGAFPLYDSEQYCAGQFIQSLDDDVQEAIHKHGIRNSHLTSIAPTGTISLTADNVSSGIEPVFQRSFQRTIQTPDGPTVEPVVDYGWGNFAVMPKTADEVSIAEHVAVLNVAQRHMDSAVSKTCNVGADVTWEQFKDVYRQAWLGGAKGCTTFRAAGKRMGILNATTEVADKQDEEVKTSCDFDPKTGVFECA